MKYSTKYSKKHSKKDQRMSSVAHVTSCVPVTVPKSGLATLGTYGPLGIKEDLVLTYFYIQ
jgi:hypothetical protein